MDRHEFQEGFLRGMCIFYDTGEGTRCCQPASDDVHMPSVEVSTGEVKLLSCPFCGKESSGGEFGPGPYLSRSQNSRFKGVICSGCCSIAYGETESRVIERWNTRSAPFLKAENERLREALKRIKRTPDHLGSAFVNDLAVQIAAAALEQKD